MPTAPTHNEQVLEAVVSGPDGVNRLFVCTGQALTYFWLGENQNAVQTFTFLIGPELVHPQFHRATASAYVAGSAVYVSDPTANIWHTLTFESVEADWDDESGKTDMRVEIRMNTGPGVHQSLERIGYSATVLAELPETET